MNAGSNASPSAFTYGDLSGLRAQREQQTVTLINQILNSVRPETAARLRAAGNVLATAIKAKCGVGLNSQAAAAICQAPK